MPLTTKRSKKGRISILGCPVHKGQHLPGVELGPEVLRKGGLVEKLTALDLDVEDQGDISLPSFEDDIHPHLNVRSPKHVAAGSEKIAKMVCRTIESGKMCLALGGDRSVFIGTMTGHARALNNPIVIWIDAHADINVPTDIETGNLHAMPLSFVVKEFKPFLPDLPGFENIEPCISAKDLVYIGLRKVSAPERKTIEDLGILTYSMHDIDKCGIGKVLAEALETVDPEGKRPIHLSFDCDGLDPSIAPCTGFPEPGGLSIREALYIAEEIASTGRLSCMDFTELNPKLGNKKEVEITVNTVIDIIQHALGNRRQGVYPKQHKRPKLA